MCVVLCILLQPNGSVPFYQEVHNFMKEYSSDASKLHTCIVQIFVGLNFREKLQNRISMFFIS